MALSTFALVINCSKCKCGIIAVQKLFMGWRLPCYPFGIGECDILQSFK